MQGLLICRPCGHSSVLEGSVKGSKEGHYQQRAFVGGLRFDAADAAPPTTREQAIRSGCGGSLSMRGGLRSSRAAEARMLVGCWHDRACSTASAEAATSQAVSHANCSWQRRGGAAAAGHDDSRESKLMHHHAGADALRRQRRL